MPTLTYIPEKPCKRGHFLRYINGKVCVECQRMHSAASGKRHYEKRLLDNKLRRRKTPEKSREAVKRWRELNPEKVKQQKAQYKYPESQKIRSARWYETNTERAKQLRAEWKAKNPEKVRFLSQKYKVSKRTTLLPWLSKDILDRINEFYAEAARLTAETGVPHHVDHEIPLQGKTVSGLHVPWNLKVISATENHHKSNRVEAE